MGMAASQARFLGLTARKTNVEFEGQQINQQRTTLGNQSANYYNQLLGMEVPVPPSVQDFTKTVYTFQDGSLNNNITALVAQQDGMYKVSYVSSWQNDFAPVSNGAAIIFRTNTTEKIVKRVYYENSDPTDVHEYVLNQDPLDNNKFTYNDVNATTHTVTYTANPKKYEDDIDGDITAKVAETVKKSGDYMVGNTQLRAISASSTISRDPVTRKYIGVPADKYLSSLTAEQLDKLEEQEHEYVGIFKKKYGNDTNWLVRYVQDTTSGVWNPIFYQQEIVEAAQYNDQTGASQSNIPSYRIGSATETEEVKGVNARLEKDATGRYINITLMPEPDVEMTYSLTTSTTTDQAAYNDAMNQYEFNKYTYDQSIQEINAKIEVVQAEDRNLELRLKQLDTEQEAIQTEMEAVEKVINKNTESTFKVFG